MPTYAYKCTVCDHAFDAVQSFHDPALTDCPQCQGRLRKMYNTVGVVFKGSGFYRTDSRTSTSTSTSESSSTSSTPSAAPASAPASTSTEA